MISFETIKSISAELYERSLRKIPDDTRDFLARSVKTEPTEIGRDTLGLMLESAALAEAEGHFVCSDSGVPVYFLKVGVGARFEGDVKRAIREGFEELVDRINPPLLPHVTNPLTLERGHFGKDMPIITVDLVDGVDYVDIICSPKALGSGRWAALKVFSFPSMQEIEDYVLEVVATAGSQPCPPVVIGVGIGGTFDYAAKLAKEATLRPIGSRNPHPILRDFEERVCVAVDAMGFGPMGTGGGTTAMAVHADYAAGHGFTPVAVSFNCWINRRRSARLYNDGRVEQFEGLAP